jgi:uncharacterized protein GlcG (DUF336 family)
MNENEIREIVKNAIIASKAEMTLPLAERVADAVIEEAQRMGIKVVVAISDAAGNPKLVKVMEDAYIASYDIAVNKAYTVVALKMPTVKLKGLAAPGGELYGIQFTNGGKIVIFGGGDPLINPKGKIIGGLGVSGGSEEQDIALSEFGKKYFETKI